MITQKQQELIDDIMDNFNFEKVHKVMKFLNWTWWDNKLEKYINPTIQELRSNARKKLKRILEENHASIGSGGFVARKYDDGTISLEFKIESWGDI